MNKYSLSSSLAMRSITSAIARTFSTVVVAEATPTTSFYPANATGKSTILGTSTADPLLVSS